MNTCVWLQEMQLLQKRRQRCEILSQVENWYTGRLHFTGTLLLTLLISLRKIEKLNKIKFMQFILLYTAGNSFEIKLPILN